MDFTLPARQRRFQQRVRKFMEAQVRPSLPRARVKWRAETAAAWDEARRAGAGN